jgi:hypothetical protein
MQNENAEAEPPDDSKNHQSNLWPIFGISDEDLEARAAWLSRDHHRFKGALVMYFRTAGSLLRFTRRDFTLLPLVFVQCVVGLESVLRHVYADSQGADSQRVPLSQQLQQASADGHFSQMPVLELAIPVKWATKPWRQLLAEWGFPHDAQWVARLRNGYLHGEYALTADFFDLAAHVRTMTDALIPHLPPSFSERIIHEQRLPILPDPALRQR